jgi:pimeloyl-ACP methyl ester carboxylesterase
MLKRIESPDGTFISYDIRRRSGRFLIFLHGLGGNLTAWNEQVKFFNRRGFSTIAIDFRGHGTSDKPRSADFYSLRRFTGDVREIIRKENVRQFFVVGHCLGGIVALAFHGFHPSLAEGYILIGSTYKTPLPRTIAGNPRVRAMFEYLTERLPAGKRNSRRRGMKKFFGTTDWNPLRIYSDLAETSPRSYLLSAGNMFWFDGSVSLRKMGKKPLLIIQGQMDSVLGTKVARKMKSLSGNSRLNIIPNANHILVLNNPKEVSAAIFSYLRQAGFVPKKRRG